MFQRFSVGADRQLETSVVPLNALTAAVALDGRVSLWNATLFLRAGEGSTTALDGRCGCALIGGVVALATQSGDLVNGEDDVRGMRRW